MTYDGELAITKPTTVNIPSVHSIITATNITPSASPPFFLYGDTYNYYSTDTVEILTSKKTDPLNFFVSSSTAVGDNITNVTPIAIGNYFYAFGTESAGGPSGTGSVYKAHINNPTSWYATASNLATPVVNGALYIDNSFLWLIGGQDNASCNIIQRATIADPTTWTNVGTLPVGLYLAQFAVVGGSLYLYGGLNSSAADSLAIYTATTADPTAWSDTGSVLPVSVNSATVYNDGSNIYFLSGTSNGGTDSATIFSATVSAPTTVTAAGTMTGVGTGVRGAVVTDSTYIYYMGGGRALLSDPLTWTIYSAKLDTAVSGACVAVNDETVYVFGGLDSSGAASLAIQTTAVNDPTHFTTSSASLPTTNLGGQIIKTSTNFYILGGGTSAIAYFTATLAAPTTWTAAGNAPSPFAPYGQALIYENYIYYFGGETTVGGSPTSDVFRAVIENGLIIESSWIKTGSNFVTGFPVLTRFSLIVAGEYIYTVGGFTSGGVINNNVYRARLASLADGSSAWIIAGTSGTTLSGTVVPINNGVYIMGGGTSSSPLNNSINSCMYASMIDLSNGIANFTQENTYGFASGAEMTAICVRDHVYLYSARNTTNGTNVINKTMNTRQHYLAMPNVIESTEGMSTIDKKTGLIGCYTAFQKIGMLPWLVTSN